MRVLIVEDSERLRRNLMTALTRSGHVVDAAEDGEDGLWRARNQAYDVIVLDIMLPKRDGLSVLAALRAAGSDVRVLLLTARDTVPDRVLGLRAGADDYLVKPFVLDELLARVDALGRRGSGRKQSVLRVADLEIDTQARQVRRSGESVELTAREYLLIEYLGRRQGEVVSRAEIEAQLYDGDADLMSNVVDSAVCSLRKKLSAHGDTPLVHTRRGLGYVLGPATAAEAGA